MTVAAVVLIQCYNIDGKVWNANDVKCKNMNMCQPRQAGTHAGDGGNADEVDRLVETLALASVGGSAQKVYWSKWQPGAA